MMDCLHYLSLEGCMIQVHIFRRDSLLFGRATLAWQIDLEREENYLEGDLSSNTGKMDQNYRSIHDLAYQ